MSQLLGSKIALVLIKPHRYRVAYKIMLQDKVIGEIELDHIAWRSGEAELKISIEHEDLHNQGYGTDAVRTLLEQAFVNMNLKRVYLRVQATNTNAIRCYEKAGFKKEGRLTRAIEWEEEEEIFLMGITQSLFLAKTSI